MEFSLKSVYNLEDELETVLAGALKVIKLEELSSTLLNRMNKDAVVKLVQSLGKLLERSTGLLKSAAADLDNVKSNQLKNQALLISTQEELVNSKTAQIDAIKSTVKTEMKTWSEVVSEKLQNSEGGTRSDTITQKKIKEAVKSVEVEKERLKNFMVYNVQEEDDDDDEDDGQDDEYTVKQILMKTAGITPARVNYERLGQMKSDTKRPIIVRLDSTLQVAAILANAKKLKGDEELQSTFIGPDRTREEREGHRKLVKIMKQKREDDPTKHFFIRNGTICSADKN